MLPCLFSPLMPLFDDFSPLLAIDYVSPLLMIDYAAALPRSFSFRSPPGFRC